VHLWVGAQDSFYLDCAAIRFSASANRLGLDVKLTVVPERDHFDLYTDGNDRLGLFKVIGQQMEGAQLSRDTVR
jgi:hypothetical protein